MPAQPTASEPASDLGLSFFEDLKGAAAAAAEAGGGWVERDIEPAGIGVRLRFAGLALAERLLPPFEHLASAGIAPEMRIDVFDSGSTGVEPPSLPWPAGEAAAGTNPVVRFESERACVLAAAATGAITAVSTATGEAVFYLTEVGRVPASERAAPLREALQILMGPHGRWMTHAGAVGRGGRGALLVGRGGSGKSTLALSCALAGMEVVADDYLLLETGPPPIAHAMQSTAKLTEDSAARLGLGPETMDRAGFEPTLEGPDKALVDIRALAPGQFKRHLKIVAVIAPTIPPLTSSFISHTETKDKVSPVVREISAAEGLRAVAPSTILQMRSRTEPVLGALGELVRAVPSYELRLSPDPVANAALVAETVEELG